MNEGTEFRILGPVEVATSTGTLPLRGRSQRAVLAVLLLHPNEVVASEQLIEELWGDHAPDTAAKIVQNAVSQLRKLLGPEVLATRAPGYVLRVDPGRLDAIRFEELVEESRRARAAGDPELASAKLQEGLGLWRGLALADLVYEPFAQAEIARLEELRLTAIEDRIDAELHLGRHADVVGELEAHVARHPLRERLPGQLMLALYRSGRQAEALALYQKTRRELIEELGIEPGPALQRLEKAILVHDPSLDFSATPQAGPERVLSAPLVPTAQPAREVRKTVSVLFADVMSLDGGVDPERRRALLERATEALSRVVEQYGGVVEQLVTSELMAVFGVPVVHEDDALRAVRAGIEMQRALAALNEELELEHQVRLGVRVGLGTGEVVAGGAGRLITGEVVAAAARLEQIARPGEILVGEGTERFVRSAARLEQVDPVVHGGTEVAAWRLLDLDADATAIPRQPENPMVGRDRELAALGHALERSERDRTAYLFTVLGPAGIGKSRLAAEFASTVGGGATILTGRCLPYGEGITFWPLAEIVYQLVGQDPREALPHLLGDDEEATLISDRIAGAIGRVERASASEDTLWAFRRLFEALARKRPLVLVLEDMHWAEETLLDLVEHVADWTRDAPVLLLCLARPELLEERRIWAGGKLNAT
jgi:DNA-binding SARP family transcriptional activator